jgi:hypothetical protein
MKKKILSTALRSCDRVLLWIARIEAGLCRELDA